MPLNGRLPSRRGRSPTDFLTEEATSGTTYYKIRHCSGRLPSSEVRIRAYHSRRGAEFLVPRRVQSLAAGPRRISPQIYFKIRVLQRSSIACGGTSLDRSPDLLQNSDILAANFGTFQGAIVVCVAGVSENSGRLLAKIGRIFRFCDPVGISHQILRKSADNPVELR